MDLVTDTLVIVVMIISLFPNIVIQRAKLRRTIKTLGAPQDLFKPIA